MYVAVKGGERAISAAHAWLDATRRGDTAVPELTVAQIEQQMRAQAQYRTADAPTAAPADGDVIEGEAVRVAETERMLDQKNDPPA